MFSPTGETCALRFDSSHQGGQKGVGLLCPPRYFDRALRSAKEYYEKIDQLCQGKNLRPPAAPLPNDLQNPGVSQPTQQSRDLLSAGHVRLTIQRTRLKDELLEDVIQQRDGELRACQRKHAVL